MWVLILIVTTGMDSINVESVQGFSSEWHCRNAGSIVKEDLKTRHGRLEFTCVRQGE